RGELLARAAGGWCAMRGWYPQHWLALDGRAMFEHAGDTVFVEDDGFGLQRRLATFGRATRSILQSALPLRPREPSAGSRNVAASFLHRFGGNVAQGRNRCRGHRPLLVADHLEPGRRVDRHLELGHPSLIAIHAVELVAEFEIGHDLPRRQAHCIVGREASPDEGGDGDGDFLERTFHTFASSPAPPSFATISAKKPNPFGNVSRIIAINNLN